MGQSVSLNERITLTGGRSTGFDYMRLILAVAIVCWHSVVTAYGRDAQHAIASGWARPLVAILLPMFFALSGFLVAGSLGRTKTLIMFLGLRAIRIYPALAVEVLLSALILGPLLTTLPLREYFAHPTFHNYFWNIIGDIHFELPGVFTSNPNPNRVNGQLWTVPFELRCYAVLAGLSLLGVIRYRWLLPVAIVGLTGVETVLQAIQQPGDFAAVEGAVPGWCLVVAFLCGVAIHVFQDKLRWSAAWGWGAGIATLILLAVPYGQYVVALPAAYFTVWLGLMNPRKVGILRGADYSYGIFLYGYAIQQAFSSLGAWTHHWWLNILVCLPAASAVAAFSWHFVEKPALGWRKYVVRLEEMWLASRLGRLVRTFLPTSR